MSFSAALAHTVLKRGQRGNIKSVTEIQQVMDDEHVSAAHDIYGRMGSKGEEYIMRAIGDARRGGDAEILNYWFLVLDEFRSELARHLKSAR